jgi:LuxR family maltose regulon positive regulatory protein
MVSRSRALLAERRVVQQEHREMTNPLLATKLSVPPAWPDWLPRPRLIERLSEGLRCKVTLISAPAGFGKTTLLSQWTRQSAVPVAWVSLDRGDNDPARFWAYFIAALQTLHRGIGMAALAMLQSPQSPPIEPLLTGLINEIAEVRAPYALVLDDLHVVADQRVNAGLAFLADHSPPQMHLILSSRADPPWPLARLRARHEMIELRARDLRFTPEEVASFVNEAVKLELSPEDAAALEDRTEGWIVGLQMAVLSMAGREDLSGFIRTLRGSHRFILDFLVEEVLDRQSPDIQDFLLETSILEPITAPLCNAVTGRDDSWAVLGRLEHANLFLVPLDDERRWYRYHHLFADLLRSRLEQARPDLPPTLHHRAGEWYERRGQIVEAVGHALQSGDVDWIERLVAGNALAVIYHGELATVVSWLNALPEEVMRSRPRLCVAHAWALAYAGELEAIEPLLQAAEATLAGRGEQIQALVSSGSERRQTEGHITAIRAYVAALKGAWSPAAELADEALQRLPEADWAVRGWTAVVLGCALRSQGHFAAAAQAFAEAIAASRTAGDNNLGVDALWEQAELQWAQGKLHQVMSTCAEALQPANQSTSGGGWQLPVTGYIYTLMSDVLREWNDLESALRYAVEGLELCKHWGQADALAQAYLRLAKVHQAVGGVDRALDAIREARQATRGLSPWYAIIAGAREARIRLGQGDVPAATRWLQESGLHVGQELKIEYQIAYVALAKVLMAQGRLDESLGLLARLLKMAEAAGAMAASIGIFILQALVLWAPGEGDQALAALERALCLAEPEGYVRIFIDEGAPMGVLLRQAAVRGIKLDYVNKLLAALESETSDKRQRPRLAPSSLVEPLSERELEVLRLLTTHLSSTEIAQELVISVSTVRSHIKNVYGKLDVHTRADAVRRARELDLL